MVWFGEVDWFGMAMLFQESRGSGTVWFGEEQPADCCRGGAAVHRGGWWSPHEGRGSG